MMQSKFVRYLPLAMKQVIELDVTSNDEQNEFQLADFDFKALSIYDDKNYTKDSRENAVFQGGGGHNIQ
jgi:hypothetical protein